MFGQYKERIQFMLKYWAACLVLLVVTGELLNVRLAWNLFLAFLPLYFIEKAVGELEGKGAAIWTSLWLIFFPNSLYPITSFIHLSTDTFYWVEGKPPLEQVVYAADIFDWLKLFLIGIGFLFSMMVGFQSLLLFEWEIRERYSEKKGYAAVLLVTVLSGLAVYWGRFLRLNSWDLLTQPWKLIREVTTADHLFAIQFAAAFALFTLAGYHLFQISRSMARQN